MEVPLPPRGPASWLSRRQPSREAPRAAAASLGVYVEDPEQLSDADVVMVGRSVAGNESHNKADDLLMPVVARTSQNYRQLPQGRAKCRTGAIHRRSNTQLSSGTGVPRGELIAAAAGFDHMVLSVIGVSWLLAPSRSNHHAGPASASNPTESPPSWRSLL